MGRTAGLSGSGKRSYASDALQNLRGGVEKGEGKSQQEKDFARDLFCRFSLKRGEKQILRELSLMPAQGIPEELYFRVSGEKGESLKRLADCLLVRRERQQDEDGSEKFKLSLHPVIAEAAREVFAPSQANCRALIHGFCQIAWNSWNQTYLENQAIEPYIFSLLAAFPRPLPWLYREFAAFHTCLWVQGYFEEAKEACRRLLEEVEQYYGGCHQNTGEISLRMAACYYNAMDFENADVWYQKSFDCLSHCRPSDERYYHCRSTASAKLSRMYRYQGKPEKAMELIEEAIFYERRYGAVCRERNLWPEEDDPVNTCSHWELQKARLLFDAGRAGEALELGKKARRAVWDEVKQGKNFAYDLNEFDRFLVKVLTSMGKFERAETLANGLVEKARLYCAGCSKEMLSCEEQLADVYRAEGKGGIAAELYRAVRERLETNYPRRREWIARIWEKERNLREC